MEEALEMQKHGVKQMLDATSKGLKITQGQLGAH